MEIDLITRLRDAAGLSGVADLAIGWVKVSRDAGYPRLILTLVSTERGFTQGAASGLDLVRVQFDFYGIDSVALLALRQALLIEMEAEREVGSTRFEYGFLARNNFSSAEELADGVTVFRASLDIGFYFSEI